MTMRDDAGEDDERLMLDSIFPVSSYPHIIAISSHIPQEPPRPPSPEPTIAVYERSVIDDNTTVSEQTPWSTITVRLVGSHPLWGHYLCATFPSHENHLSHSDCQCVRRWNAARALARYLERTPTLYSGKDTLELGAGAGLPSLVVAKSGARTVRN